MTVSQDESALAQGINENMTLNDDQHEVPNEHQELPSTTTAGSFSDATMVCTADSCSIPLHGSQADRLSDPMIADASDNDKVKPSNNNNKNNNNRRNKKNKNSKGGGGAKSQQSVSSIQQIHTQSDLNKVLQQHDTVLLEFVTTWCTACHGIQPLYEELAQQQQSETQHGSETMLRATQVVCDKNKETKKLADANGVGSYPVFVLFEHGKEVNKWKGADIGKLEKVFDQYGATSGGGKRGKGGKGKKGKGRR